MNLHQREKSKQNENPLPLHSLAKDQFPAHVEDISYQNPYDFKREHRHDYFEIFFFKKGGGIQLIDFVEFPVIKNSCYIVFPQQVHLFKRSPEATGQLVQFREELIPSFQIKNMLHQAFFKKNPAVIFENNIKKIQQVWRTLDLLKEASESTSKNAHEITRHFLQALLLQLIEHNDEHDYMEMDSDKKMMYQFQKLLDAQFLQNHAVHHYAMELNITEKKLSIITKKHLGISPLQVIHNRILLEAKRLLLFEKTANKEIAYYLGFDSPASFSQFIKNKTGSSPSELYTQLVNIHK